MMDNVSRKNTVKCQFDEGNEKPTDLEMIRFAIKENLRAEDVESMNIDKGERAIFIKFKTREQCDAFLVKSERRVFVYDSGMMTKIAIQEATDVKYVRVFNLPMEIDDNDIAQELQEYGTIKKVVKEKYSESTGFPVCSTVRGVHIELKKEIPNIITVRRWRARVHYHGQKMKCYFCLSENHKQEQCEQRRGTNTNTVSSYSDAVLASSKAVTYEQHATASTSHVTADIANQHEIDMEMDTATPKPDHERKTANSEFPYLFTEDEMQDPSIVKIDPIHAKLKESKDKLKNLQGDPKRARKSSK